MGRKLRRHLKRLFDFNDSGVDEVITLAFSRRGTLGQHKGSVRFLHTLLDGTVDFDKLDYVERDAHHCGVPYGNYLDIERLVETMRVIQSNPAETPRLAFDWRGIGCLEQLATARHQMYANVYWHRAVRSATAMFKHAFFLYAQLASTSRSIEQIFFDSNADDAVLAAMHDLHGIPKRKQSAREAETVKNLIAAVSGYNRILYKEVFGAHYSERTVNVWGRTYSDQRKSAAQLFSHLKQMNIFDRRADLLGEHNILIDCRADEPPDFDLIPIIVHPNKPPIRLGDESRIITDLKENFKHQACRVRVFINPLTLRQSLQSRENREQIEKAVEGFVDERE